MQWLADQLEVVHSVVEVCRCGAGLEGVWVCKATVTEVWDEYRTSGFGPWM